MEDLHPECADLEMADCHRCPTTVVDMANALIAVNKNRLPRALNPLQDKGPGEVAIVQVPYLSSEAKWITKKVAGLLASGVHPSEIIILVQRAVAGRPILEALKRRVFPPNPTTRKASSTPRRRRSASQPSSSCSIARTGWRFDICWAPAMMIFAGKPMRECGGIARRTATAHGPRCRSSRTKC